MIYITIECEDCGKQVVRELKRVNNKTRMVARLRAVGWSFGRGVRCPTCKSKARAPRREDQDV